MQFFESLFSFPNEIDKNDHIEIFYWLIINTLSPTTCWQQKNRGLYGAEPPPVYQHG